ncbi:hypothetical protein VP01_1952g1 [Puccinia sorghi]|uniref:Uncharacterized protein n=1 Tax=Puccinia sorghi TaxID=27349 RepID=A0A0L6VCL5_9BASI|nr:hypothetical protein VP01_1952g1 [Puccinia sorghi]
MEYPRLRGRFGGVEAKPLTDQQIKCCAYKANFSGLINLVKKALLFIQNSIAQLTYQNPNHSNGHQYAGKICSLGWRKGHEEASQIGMKVW